MDGKIDIITKNVSRFVRNTIDSFFAIWKLKDNGMECYFEKKDFYRGKAPKNTVESVFFGTFGRVSDHVCNFSDMMAFIKMPKARKGWNSCLDWLPAYGSKGIFRQFTYTVFLTYPFFVFRRCFQL